ncbi:MAG: hypothetical protein AAF252_09850 [Pseudomonadota bacterium]
MLNIYAHTFMTATGGKRRCTPVTHVGKRKWWQARPTTCVDLERL